MFKLCPILVATLALGALTLAELQLLVPEDNLTLLTGSGKSLQSRLSATAAPSTATAAASSEESLSDDDDDDDDSSSSSSSANNDNAPASVTRLSQLSAGRASNRRGLLPVGGLSSLQHHILPAEAIPLPITFAARAGLRTIIAPETITIHQPTVAKIGEVVQKIPTAVSHQSQTVVHKHARVVTPIVAPALRSISSQLVRTIHQPVILAEQARLLRVLGH